MGDLHRIDDFTFEFGTAEALERALLDVASTLERQVGERDRYRAQARVTWQGRYGDDFDARVLLCNRDAERFAGALRDAARDLAELVRLAREEKHRRSLARDWQERSVVETFVDWVTFNDEPPLPPLTEPPRIVIGCPPPASREDAIVSTGIVRYSNGVSSADPDVLDYWVTTSHVMDEVELAPRVTDLDDLHQQFSASLKPTPTSSPCDPSPTTWGAGFDASALLKAIGEWATKNQVDRERVAVIADAFRQAGCGGAVPDAHLYWRLAEKDLDLPRTSTTFDEPSVWGGALTSGYADDPVNMASGNFVETEVDLAVGGSARLLGFARTYNSRSDRDGPFGRGWASWASARLRAEPDGAHWVSPDGQELVVARSVTNGDDGRVEYPRVPGLAGLVVVEGEGLAIEWFGGGSCVFDAAGLPLWRDEGPGTRVRFTHEGERLVEMAHEAGRTLRFAWGGEGNGDGDAARVVGVTSSDGRAVTYTYDEAGRLIAADGGPRGWRSYEVDGDGRIVAVTDADGVVELRNDYDDEGRVQGQASPFGRRSRFRYLAGGVAIADDDAGGPVNSYVHDDRARLVGVVDGHGAELARAYDEWDDAVQVTERDGSVETYERDDRSRLVRRTAADGSWDAFRYDDRDRVVEITTSDGAVTRHSYTGDERIPAEVHDPEGGTTLLTVEAGLVRRVVDPDGVELAFGYTADGELSSITDALGNATRIERDPAGRVTAVVSPSGRRTTTVHDAAGRPVERQDSGGGTWRYEWSPAGRLLAVVDPVGGRYEQRYGSHGRAEQVVDELGQVTTHRYDEVGNLVALALPDGAKWELTYDALGRLTSLGDPAGATWLREHDTVGRVVGTVDPTGARRTATFDTAGRPASVDDGSGPIEVDRDLEARTATLRQPDGAEVAVGYDRCGRVISVADPAGQVTRYEYSPGGRCTAVIAPSGRTTRAEYDRCGRLAAVIDPEGGRWERRYDADGHLIEIVDPTGETTRFRYDAPGRLSARVSPSGGVTRYDRDAAGRVVATTDPAGGVVRYEHDERGLLAAAVDPNGGVVRYEHDQRGFLRAMVDPLGGRVTYDRDPLGRLLAATDQLGRRTTWDYDAAGRLVARTLPTGEQVRWWHDEAGRVRAIGPGDEPLVHIERDALGRPVVVEEPGMRHELEWDAAGRLLARSRNGLRLAWHYDIDGRRVAIVRPDGTETTFAPEGTVRTVHDAAGRLVGRSSDSSDGGSESWRYEGGLLTGHESRTGEGEARVTELARDAAGRVVRRTVDGVEHGYTYDPAGQLVAADGPDGAWTFSYDAAGRLVAETGPDGPTSYVYDAAHQLAERRCGEAVSRFDYDAAGRRVRAAGPNGEEQRWSWDWQGRLCGIDDVVLTVDVLGDLADVDGRALLWDAVAPVPQLCWLDGAAVVAGGPADRDAWGAHLGGPATEPGARRCGLGYRGELEVEGLLWLRNRVYDPATRAFLSTDPLPGVPGTPFVANPYHYAGNSPISAHDPLGLSPLTDADLRRYREDARRNIWDNARGVAWAGLSWAGEGALGRFADRFPGVDRDVVEHVSDLRVIRTGPRVEEYEAEILRYAAEYKLDPTLLAAVIEYESGGRQRFGEPWRVMEDVGRHFPHGYNTFGIAGIDPSSELAQEAFSRAHWDISPDEARHRLIYDDDFAVEAAAAYLDNLKHHISDVTNEHLFVGYKFDRANLEALDHAGWVYKDLPGGESAKRAGAPLRDSFGYVNQLQRETGAFGGLHDEYTY